MTLVEIMRRPAERRRAFAALPLVVWTVEEFLEAQRILRRLQLGF